MPKQIHPTVTIFLDYNGTIQLYPPNQGEESIMMCMADTDDPTQGSTIVVMKPHEIEALITALQGELNQHRAFTKQPR